MYCFICPVCNSSFSRAGKDARFCSRECTDQAKRDGAYWKRESSKAKRSCAFCSKEFEYNLCHALRKGRGDVARYCSKECGRSGMSRKLREKNSGKTKRVNGYLFEYSYDHPVVIARRERGSKNNFYPQHRLTMEKHLGRHLEKHENVHHINGVKDDNRIENLELWDRTQPVGQRDSDLRKEIERLRSRIAELERG